VIDTQSIATSAAHTPSPAGSALLARAELRTEDILARSAGENFPVAFRWLPNGRADELMAIYGFARLVDQIGDAAEGDRLVLLEAVLRDLEQSQSRGARHPIIDRYASVAAKHSFPFELAERLVEANRRDQQPTAIEDHDALLDYCSCSANPVGEMVLRLFDQENAKRVSLSNDVCSALQIIEHCQDVLEDQHLGRVYLPKADLARFDCPRADLARAPASEPLRQVVALQVTRSRALLSSAEPLLRELNGGALLLVAGYAASGLATCDALDRGRWDVTSSVLRPRRRDRLRHWLGLLWRSRVGR